MVISNVCCSSVCCSLNYYTSILSSYIGAGISFLFRTSVLPLLSFLRVSVLPSAASTLPSVEAPTFVRFLNFLYLGFVTLVYFPLRSQLFFIFRCHLFSSLAFVLSRTIFHFSYLMKPAGETSLILLSVVL